MERANPRHRRGGGVKRNADGGHNLSPRKPQRFLVERGATQSLDQKCSDLEGRRHQTEDGKKARVSRHSHQPGGSTKMNATNKTSYPHGQLALQLMKKTTLGVGNAYRFR